MTLPWQKAPTPMVAELSACVWSSANPAPNLVGFMWAQSIRAQGGKVSSRQLQRYAGWTHWRARQVLKQVEDFADNQGRTNQPHDFAHLPHTSRTPPAHPTQVEPTHMGESPHTFRTPPAQSPHTTRARDPSLEKEKKKERGELVSLWAEVNAIRKEHHHRPVKLTDSRARALKARVREHSEQDVLSVVRWWLTAGGRAAYLREQKFSIDTILRPSNFPAYLEMAEGGAGPRPIATVEAARDYILSDLDAWREDLAAIDALRSDKRMPAWGELLHRHCPDDDTTQNVKRALYALAEDGTCPSTHLDSMIRRRKRNAQCSERSSSRPHSATPTTPRSTTSDPRILRSTSTESCSDSSNRAFPADCQRTAPASHPKWSAYASGSGTVEPAT